MAVEEQEAFTLDQWIEAKTVDYGVPDEAYTEIKGLLDSAAAKCQELGIPFTFAMQTALRSEDLGSGIGGTSWIGVDPGRVGPDALLAHLLFMRTHPQEALAMVSWAVQQKQSDQGAPQIIVPHH